MNGAQIHLALTHLPVVLSLTGLVMLVVSFFNKKQVLIHASFAVLIAAALATIPVYATGEGAEEMVEEMAGVSESIIGQHEDVAQWSLIIILITGGAALIGYFLRKKPSLQRPAQMLVLLLALASGGLMAQTAHLGGQIRHSEIRSGAVAQAEGTENTGDGEAAGAAEGHGDHDDDD